MIIEVACMLICIVILMLVDMVKKILKPKIHL